MDNNTQKIGYLDLWPTKSAGYAVTLSNMNLFTFILHDMLSPHYHNSAPIEIVVLVVALVSDLWNFVVSGGYCVDHEKWGGLKLFYDQHNY